ncbi:hypothetical protein BGZ61DRAFT_455061 [Ilyonectria robusta]|uniref:uncharacterized protein n=1 Tax=Ilyonectria robusta TaxID=1079257 RepID=UPI001E8D131D|nr:uncharacterized protein BGZ61DRAFT_455061 [Ilyonectria robusta]KAH8685194.1 hypothetical protein BGZ61DRAFT_455061 [Ilyonectria robusta]
MVACSPFVWSSGGFVPLWLVVIVLTFCSGQRSVACSLPPQVYLEMPTRRDRLESRIRRNKKTAKASGPGEPSRVYRPSPGLSEAG